MIIIREKSTVEVIKHVRSPEKGVTYEPSPLGKKCVRVWPVNGRDVFLIQATEHQEERFAPATGSGIILTDSAIQRIM